jgi:hypothetical protein
MKIAKNRTAATTIALFLMLTITATSIIVTSAHDPYWTVPTRAYVTCAPNPVGVGQYTTIVVWVDYYSPTATGSQGQHWDGFQINITKPDGTTQIIGPFTCGSAVGSDYRTFTPDQVGTYTIVFSWPGEFAENSTEAYSVSTYAGDWFTGATSAPCTLTVQQDPIALWPEPPLPTGYWQVPINAANRGWSTIASNWLKGSQLDYNFQTSGTAPESAHVLWTQPITPTLAGGINDAWWPGIPSDVNDYESPWSAPIIMNGKIYYNSPGVADVATYGYYCKDLYTGETIWFKNGTDNGLNNPYTIAGGYSLSESYVGLTQGQLYYYYSVNGQGILAYLVMVQGSTWYFLDSNGNFMLKLINVPGGTSATDQDGSLLKYSYNPTTGNLLCWNSSQSIPPLSPLGTSQQQWKMRFGATIDAVNDTSWTVVGPSPPGTLGTAVTKEMIQPRSGYTMNVTIQKGLPGGIISVLRDDKNVPKMIFGGYMANPGGMGSGELSAAAYVGSAFGAGTSSEYSVWVIGITEHATGYSPYPGQSATQNNNLGFAADVLWYKNFTVPLPNHNYTWYVQSPDYDSDTFLLYCKQTSQMWCFSLTTGAMLWGPVPSLSNLGPGPNNNQMDFYGTSQREYYGKIIRDSSYGGTLEAYDVTTGALLWTYNATAPGYESAYGQNMPLSISAVADGKIYTTSGEHSPTKPLWRASYIRCINITDGKELWKLLDFSMGVAIADGYIVTASQYDNLMYCIGKGPSATTVSAPQSGVTLGNSFTITGTVTDQSPGAVAIAKKMGYTNGVACVPDADQQAWMEYLYEQQAYPTTITGVDVALDLYDPNGNYVHIGDTTSDLNGFYSFQVDQNMLGAGPGKYTLVATFAGSNSYASSFAETAFTVNPAPAATPPIEYPQPIDYTMAIVGAAVVLLIAIAIVGILILRKK